MNLSLVQKQFGLRYPLTLTRFIICTASDLKIKILPYFLIQDDNFKLMIPLKMHHYDSNLLNVLP